jgi:hypothetical protein
MRYFYVPLLLLVLGSAPSAQQPITVDRKALKAQSIRVVGQQDSRVPPQTASRIGIARNELLVARTGERVTETVVNDRRRFELPLEIVGVAPAGGRLNLGAVVEVAGGGLRLREDASGFEGQIFVGIEDKDNPSGMRTLGRQVQFLVTADADLVEPSTMTIEHANLPYSPVLIRTSRTATSVSVRIRPDFEPKGFEIEVDTVRPRVTLSASPPAIQGLGLETTEIRVGVSDALVNPGVLVNLNAEGGRLSSTELALGAGGTAVATLRSSGVGDATVRASHAFLAPAEPLVVRFLFPWAFAIAVTLGGAIGGVLRYGVPKRRKGRRIDMWPLVGHAIFGILAGLVVAVAYAVGINLLNVQPNATAGEALVFVLAALGALASSARLVKMVLGESEAEAKADAGR